MHDAAEPVGLPVLGDEGEEIFPGVGGSVLRFGLRGGEPAGSAVDEDGLAGIGGDLHLRDESLLLGGNVGIVEVVIVKPDFADGDTARIGGESG